MPVSVLMFVALFILTKCSAFVVLPAFLMSVLPLSSYSSRPSLGKFRVIAQCNEKQLSQALFLSAEHLITFRSDAVWKNFTCIHQCFNKLRRFQASTLIDRAILTYKSEWWYNTCNQSSKLGFAWCKKWSFEWLMKWNHQNHQTRTFHGLLQS